MSNYELIIPFIGYSNETENGLSANCTCALLMSPSKNIIIDTRTPWDGEDVLKAIKHHNLSIKDIHYCISTHGHSDHVGCNYLFKDALHIVGKNCISKKDIYYSHDFAEPYVIDEHVKIVATPGHTSECITVLVTTKQGLVAITGDLFENEEDLEDETIWKCCSEFPELQAKSRKMILEVADYIVPGHGKMFKNSLKISDTQSLALRKKCIL